MPSPTQFQIPGGLRQASVLLTGLLTTPVVHFPAYAQADGSCPLTVKQEVAAVKAFKKFAPIFGEPRCVNCHGAVNPFAENGGHPQTIDIREEAQEFLRRPDLQEVLIQSGLDQKARDAHLPQVQGVAESSEGITDTDRIRDEAFLPMREKCKTCHIDAWIIPKKINHFVNRSEEELCLHLKTSDLTSPADRFLQHMQADELVLEGFKGTRGLESSVTPTPPAMPFSTLEKYVNAWVEAMEGKFHKPPDCGCKIHGLVLQIQHRIDTDPTDAGYRIGVVKYGGAVDLSVRLEPVPKMPEGWFSGKASAVRPISVYHPKCSGKSAPRPEDWEVRGFMDDEGTSMRILFFIDFDEDPQGTLTCPHHSMELEAVISSRLEHRNDMHIPTTTGATAQFQSKEFDNRESLTITVMNGSESK